MQLSEYIELLPYDVAFWLASLKEPGYPFEAQGDMSLEVSFKLRAVAVLFLLVRAETDVFHHNLIRSGILREEYLTRCRAESQTDDHHYASGRLRPFFDALASGDTALAGRIAALSPLAFRQDHEYEDDYCYAQILHRLLQPSPPAAEVQALFQQFQGWLAGESSPRLDVCRALAARDQRAFEDAFEALLADRKREITANLDRGQLEDAPVIADRRVFIEGLAILRLATLRGLRTLPDYPMCPSLARIPMRTPFPGE